MRKPKKSKKHHTQIQKTSQTKRPLSIYFYESGLIEGLAFENHLSFLSSMQLWGLPINPLIKPVKNDQGIINYHKETEQIRNKLPYEIDGTVFKVNDYKLRDDLGTRSRSPRWAVAGKIEWQ